MAGGPITTAVDSLGANFGGGPLNSKGPHCVFACLRLFGCVCVLK